MFRKRLFFLIFSCFIYFSSKAEIIFLPAGNKKNAGRKLYEQYERGITFQIATALEKTINKTEQRATIFFDQKKNQKENITELNQKNPEWIISIGAFKTDTLLPIISLYHLSYDPLKEALPLVKNKSELVFCKELPQIHLKQNIILSDAMHTELSKESAGKFQLLKPLFLPYKKLIGLNAPTLHLEIGLNNDAAWQPLIESISKGIENSIKKITLQKKDN